MEYYYKIANKQTVVGVMVLVM